MSTDKFTQFVLPAIAVLLLLLVALVIRRRRKAAGREVSKVFKTISFGRLTNLLIPSTDDGEILVDNLLLTAKGLLVVDIKDVKGAVFGSDRMQDWTVINGDRRFTFANPQQPLYDRVAAVKQMVREVPVTGRVVFLEGAEFTKGVPSQVCMIEDMIGEFGKASASSSKQQVEAYRTQWDHIRTDAVTAQVGKLIR